MDNEILEHVTTFLDCIIETAAKEHVDGKVLPMIEDLIKQRYGFLPQVHEVKTETKTTTFTEPLHEKFDEVLETVARNIPVFLTGKAGVGKNVICKQVAKALDLEFYFTNAVTQEYKLTGFIDANGVYHETQFYKAFTKGGLFFLDEMDASIPEVLIILNAAISNGYFDFPTGKVEAHPNFRVVAAGNTVGTGADDEYTGRYSLDRASLDRFVLVEIDYCKEIERAITNDNKELIKFAHSFREVVSNAGIKSLCSYRALHQITKLETCLPLAKVLIMTVLKGLDVDDVTIIQNEFKRRGCNDRYSNCLKSLQLKEAKK